jgi:hypothetical protein
MGLIGNYSLLHKSPGHYATGTVGFSDPANWNKSGIMASRLFGADLAEYDSMPPGFYAGRAAFPPQKAGRCATVSAFTFSGSASGAEGLPGSAGSTITFIADAIGGLIAGGIASATITFSGSASGAGLAAGSASGTIVFTGSAAQGAIAWGIAEGTCTFTGAAQAYALAHGTATTIDTTGLTTSGIALAVWRAMATENSDEGTMGKLLNMAGSGGVDYDLLAQAILAAAQITPIHSEVKNIEEVSDTILTDSRTLTTSKFMGLK